MGDDVIEESPSLWYGDEKYPFLTNLISRTGMGIRSSTAKRRSPKAIIKMLWDPILLISTAASAVLKCRSWARIFGTGRILAASTIFQGPYKSSLTLFLGRESASIGGKVKISSIITTRSVANRIDHRIKNTKGIARIQN